MSNVLAEEIKSLPTIRTKLTPHSIERLAERGITKKMAEKVIEKEIRYYDPLNKSIVYVLHNGMASGEHLALAIVPHSRLLKTIYTMRPTYFPKRLIPID